MRNIKKYNQFLVESTKLYCSKCGEYKGDQKEGDLCVFCDKPNTGEGTKLYCLDCGEYTGGLKDNNLCDSCEDKIDEGVDTLMTIEDLRIELAHYIEVIDDAELQVSEMSPFPANVDTRGSVYLEDLTPDLKFRHIVIDINNSSLDLDDTLSVKSFHKFYDDEFLRLKELEERLEALGYTLCFQFGDDQFSLFISK